MRKNLKPLRVLAFIVVFGGLIVLATQLHGAAALAIWLVWLILLVGTAVVAFSAKPSLMLDKATKQVLADWQAAHPDRKFGWRTESLPNPAQRGVPTDPALLGRFSGDPPFGPKTDRVVYLGRTTVAGHGVLVLDLGWFDASFGTVRNRVTAVSLDTPGPAGRVCVYRRAGYQRAGWYRALAFWRFTTGDAVFDARFRVDADDRAAARRLLTPAVTGFLANDPRAEHLGVTLERGTLNVWLRDKLDVDVIAPMIDLMMELYSRIPAQAWRGVA